MPSIPPYHKVLKKIHFFPLYTVPVELRILLLRFRLKFKGCGQSNRCLLVIRTHLKNNRQTKSQKLKREVVTEGEVYRDTERPEPFDFAADFFCGFGGERGRVAYFIVIFDLRWVLSKIF